MLAIAEVMDYCKGSNARLGADLDQASSCDLGRGTRRGSSDIAAGSPEPEDLARQKALQIDA